MQVSTSLRALSATRRLFAQVRVNGGVIGRITDDDFYVGAAAGTGGMLPIFLVEGQILTASFFTDGQVTMAATSSTQLVLMEI